MLPQQRSRSRRTSLGRVAGSLAVLLAIRHAAGADAASQPGDGTPAVRHAFATSITGSGDLSTWQGATGTGMAAGDATCQARATAASLTGTYVAWLSTGANDAYCHVQGLAGIKDNGCNGAVLPGAGPWVRTDGKQWSGTLDELVTANLLYTPLVTDELGTVDIATAQARWTGTRSDGTGTGGDCDGWTSTSAPPGDAGRGPTTAGSWTLDSSPLCSDTTVRLICLETGPGLPAVKPKAPGALVFVSSITGKADLSSWPGSRGHIELAAGDSICQSLATAANLPDPATFVAWLSDGSAKSIVDRVATDGPWKRLDGFAIAGSKADLLDSSLATPISQDETGAYPDDAPVWTGTDPAGVGGIYHCNDWKSPLNSGIGLTGQLNNVRASWTDDFDLPCDGLNHIYCLSNVVSVFFDGFERGDTSNWDQIAPQ